MNKEGQILQIFFFKNHMQANFTRGKNIVWIICLRKVLWLVVPKKSDSDLLSLKRYNIFCTSVLHTLLWNANGLRQVAYWLLREAMNPTLFKLLMHELTFTSRIYDENVNGEYTNCYCWKRPFLGVVDLFWSICGLFSGIGIGEMSRSVATNSSGRVRDPYLGYWIDHFINAWLWGRFM